MDLPRALADADPGRMPVTEVDVLVVGSGVAGLSAALALPRSVLLATKSSLGQGSTRYAQGGIAAAFGPLDDPEDHLADTLAAGAGLCDPAAVRVLVEGGADAIAWLMALGTRFDGGPADPARTLEGGHGRARILHAGGDATGAEIERALVAAVRAAPHVRIAEEAFLVDLLTDADGAVAGAVLAAGGTLRVVRAAAVVVASGGAGQLYAQTTNPPSATGDGIAAALRAGAAIADLEFVQFHPTALHVPADPRPLVSEALRGEGAVLRDATGDRVMPGIHPREDLAPRDVVTRALADRMRRLGADHLLLDATGVEPARLERRFPTILAVCRSHGIDPVRVPIPVSPAAHYLMGGIRTDLDGAASLPGLSAVGEAACTGVHGANRLASNSLLEGVVFAQRVAAALTADLPRPGPPLPVRGGATAPLPRPELRAALTARAGVLRGAGGLAALAAELAGPGAPCDRELANLTQLGAALGHLAARRTESRGSHWREDAPDTAEAWRVRQSAVRRPDGTLDVEHVPLSVLEAVA